jgi:UDP-N-acetylmuramate dehydrogenase
MRPIFEQHISLQPFNTFGIDQSAQLFARFNTANQLSTWIKEGMLGEQELLVLGGGSNILLTNDFEGLVLKNEITGINFIKEDASHVWVEVGAGVNWHEFVLHCIDHNWAGVENLSLIPGTVGAAPMQNIGAYGVELKDVFDSLIAIQINTGAEVVFNKEECAFGYRESVFKNVVKGEFLITSVTFKLFKQPTFHLDYGAIRETLASMKIEPTIRSISDAVIAIRRSKLPDPAVIGNAGSFFKNPVVNKSIVAGLKETYPEMPTYPVNEDTVKVPAGWLIEKCGWKGYRKGDIGVHQHQALVLVNYGGGKGNELYKLALAIQASVEHQFGIFINTEVNIVGRGS